MRPSSPFLDKGVKIAYTKNMERPNVVSKKIKFERPQQPLEGIRESAFYTLGCEILLQVRFIRAEGLTISYKYRCQGIIH